MNIISHRGYWQHPQEKNSVIAFERSFSLGFGTETDVRDLAGELVISHDMPKGDELTLDQLLELAAPTKPLLAINIKSDGLAFAIRNTMSRHSYESYFVFDMSIPDTRMQLKAGNPVYMRMSEVEKEPPYQQEAAGIWLDAFETDAWRIEVLAHLLSNHQHVCLVSPELHQRDYKTFWDTIKSSELDKADNLVLCTDVPEYAYTFFQENR